MHQAALKAARLRGWYIPLQATPESLPGILRALSDLNFTGLNVTSPLKEDALRAASDATQECRRIGAANTLTREMGSGLWFASNTDAPGFSEAYLSGVEPSRALVLGAGGASRAVVAALQKSGFTPVVSNRTASRAEALAKRLGAESLPWRGIQEEFPLVVNTATASTEDELMENPPDAKVAKGGLVVDVNYGRPRNFYRLLAENSKALFYDGLLMLAAQARLSFMQWTAMDDVSLQPFADGMRRFLDDQKAKAPPGPLQKGPGGI
jgi:shikimate dehydrogenase